MPIKNTSTTIHILAWNTDEQIGQIDDEGNITVRGVGDGTEFTPASPSITPIDDTNLKGVYSIALTAAENNYDIVTVGGISSTSDVVIIPFSWANEQAGLAAVLVDTNEIQGKLPTNYIMGSTVVTAKDGAIDNIETDTNELQGLISSSKLPAQVEGMDDIDFSATQKTSLNAATPASVGSVTGNVDGSVASVTNAVTITSNSDITAILADTNELQALISDSKLPAQVEGMDADVLTASALATNAVAEITAAIWAKLIDGTITFEQWSKILLAFTAGKVVITSNSFAFYDQSDTLLFTLPITITGRVPVIA